MKKLLALVLVLLLAFPLIAGAEGATYIRQIPQSTYFSLNLITKESYREVNLTTAYTGNIFGGNAEPPLFLCFPYPNGALCHRIESGYVHCLNVENEIQYGYQLMSSYSYEEFINKAEKDEYILLDGEDKTAAYIDPSRSYAYGLIGVTEFGKSAKLMITIRIDSFSYNTEDEKKIAPLTQTILDEIARVKASMHTETKDPFWNSDTYAGVKMIFSENDSTLIKIDFPEMVENGMTPKVSVTTLNDNRVNVIYAYESGEYTEAEITIEDHSYAASKLETEDDCYTVQLGNGSEWIVYFSNRRDDGTSSYVHISKVLDNLVPAKGKEKTIYLSALLNGNRGITWTQEEINAILEHFDTCYTIMSVDDDPYVPEAEPEVTAAPEAQPDNTEAPAAAEGTWTCSSCGTEGNTGKFCTECGAARPEDAEWTCPNCGQEHNTGKFCPNCGNAKP